MPSSARTPGIGYEVVSDGVIRAMSFNVGDHQRRNMLAASPRLSLSVIKVGGRLPNRIITSKPVSSKCWTDSSFVRILIKYSASATMSAVECAAVSLGVFGFRPYALHVDLRFFRESLCWWILSKNWKSMGCRFPKSVVVESLFSGSSRFDPSALSSCEPSSSCSSILAKGCFPFREDRSLSKSAAGDSLDSVDILRLEFKDNWTGLAVVSGDIDSWLKDNDVPGCAFNLGTFGFRVDDRSPSNFLTWDGGGSSAVNITSLVSGSFSIERIIVCVLSRKLC